MTANVPRPRDRNSNLKKYYGLGANNGNQSLDIGKLASLPFHTASLLMFMHRIRWGRI